MQKQRLQQNQQLKLSPQQIQFLSLLQIPIISLEKRIEKELEDNPALEESQEENWEYEYNLNYRSQHNQEDNRPVIAEREETLQEFLLKQLPLQTLNEEESFLATFLIGCLDDNGGNESTVIGIYTADTIGTATSNNNDVLLELTLVSSDYPIRFTDGTGSEDGKEFFTFTIEKVEAGSSEKAESEATEIRPIF